MVFIEIVSEKDTQWDYNNATDRYSSRVSTKNPAKKVKIIERKIERRNVLCFVLDNSYFPAVALAICLYLVINVLSESHSYLREI